MNSYDINLFPLRFYVEGKDCCLNVTLWLGMNGNTAKEGC